MRSAAIALVAMSLAACSAGPGAPPSQECYLDARYAGDSEVLQRAWDHLQGSGQTLLTSGGGTFAEAYWYNRGQGRAGFVYYSDCAHAREATRAALEAFARSANDSDVAQTLRAASIQEVTQAQYESTEP